MRQEFHAIYENGVLRLTSPLVLPESTEVVGSFQAISGDELDSIAVDPLLGLMKDEPDLLDQVVNEALTARERDLFRTNI